jgi:predicted RNase H-like HicB family nuclease
MTAKIKISTSKLVGARKLIFRVPIIVEFDSINYRSYSPSLKGLHMDGDTEKEALENARKTARDFLEIMIRDGIPIPLGILTWEEAKKLPDSKEKEGYYEEDIIINLK